METPFGLLLGALWGGVVSYIIRWTKWGRTLATYMMWLVVSVGVGIDMLIAMWLFMHDWFVSLPKLAALFFVSALPIAISSVMVNLVPQLEALYDGLKDKNRE